MVQSVRDTIKKDSIYKDSIKYTYYFFLTDFLMLAQMFMENCNLHRFTLAAERVNMLKNQHNNRISVSKTYLAQLWQLCKECVI